MKRVAPNLQFVLMYRKCIPTSKIAALEDIAETTVRYHLQIAARAEPGIRDEHKAALPLPARRTPEAGLRNLADVLAFHELEGRLPVTYGNSRRERALGAWLAHRRRESAQGTLFPTYGDALAGIPGWDKPPTRRADDEACWQQTAGGTAEDPGHWR